MSRPREEIGLPTIPPNIDGGAPDQEREENNEDLYEGELVIMVPEEINT